MASGYTTSEAAANQDATFAETTKTASTSPMKLAVETVAGTAGAAGTELGSTTRGTLTMGAATGTPPVSSNSAACNVVAGASGTVVAIAVWDSAATPVRKAFGPLASSRTVVAGDTLAFAIGAITFTTQSP